MICPLNRSAYIATPSKPLEITHAQLLVDRQSLPSVKAIGNLCLASSLGALLHRGYDGLGRFLRQYGLRPLAIKQGTVEREPACDTACIPVPIVV